MNKPATKEPSMDEILSSIRQIIADDDAASVPRRPSILSAPPPMQATPVHALGAGSDRDLSDMLEDVEPLALDASQIVEQGQVEAFSFESILADTEASTDVAAAALTEPEDVTFDLDTDLPSFEPAPARPAIVHDEPVFAPFSQPKLTAVDEFFVPEAPKDAVADTSPLPDPELSAEIARELLEPATRAAVRGSIGKLNALGIGNPTITIEQMTRELLRPMLKDWLDEHLPAVVERMVEREISKISRGE